MRKTLCLLMLIASLPASAETIRGIDRGGDLKEFRRHNEWRRATGERVVVDGVCNSACTTVLMLPPGQACATPRGRFGFHWVTDGLTGLPRPRENDRLMSEYPEKVRRYIEQRGGLWSNVISAPALAFLPHC